MSYSITHAKLYDVWSAMHNRCYYKTNPQYKDYGGRGIVVCDRWFYFENFLADMGEPPNKTTLERVDNNKGYFPDNCVWATRTQQQLNRRILKSNKSGIKGVYWAEAQNNWQVKFLCKYIGTYSTLLDAAAARFSAECKHVKNSAAFK